MVNDLKHATLKRWRGATSRWIVVLLACLAASCRATPAPSWVARETVTHREANVYLTCRWDPATGIALRLRPAKGDGCVLQGVLGRHRPSFKLVSGSPSLPDFEKRIHLFAPPLPESSVDIEVTLRRRARGWAVYLGPHPAVELPEAFQGDLVLEHATTALPSAQALDVLVQKVAPFTFADAFMVPEDTEQKLGAWEILSGSWRLHTAAEHLELHGRYQKGGRAPGPEADRSPNFYSLDGSGTNALIVTGYDFYDRYTARAAVKYTEGECGLAFLVTIDGGVYGFTLREQPETQRLDALLWRSDTGDLASREVLGAVRTELLPNQWYRLEVQIDDRRIIARIDHMAVLNLTMPLPAGGRFGLIVDHTGGTRFDDVEAWSHEDLAPADEEQLRGITQGRSGRFSDKRKPLAGLPSGEAWTRQQRHLSAQTRRERATWRIGTTADRPRALTMRFAPTERAAFGLIAGYREADTNRVEFSCEANAAERVYQLERHTSAGRELLDSVTNAVADGTTPVTLRLDLTESDAIRAYADDQLMLLAPANPHPSGAVGWFVEPESRVEMSLPVAQTHPRRFRNRFEKNQNFATDPFMRHWSSPEGQWVTMPDGTTWYKGDFFGRYALHLPYKENTALHLGIREGETDGVLQISAAKGTVSVTWHGENAPTNGLPLARFRADQLRAHPVSEKTLLPWISIEQQDALLWIRSEDHELLRTHLPTAPGGRRIRIAGYTTEELKFSQVDQYQILDCLFTESPFRWTLHGGRWEIVNRFQCQPKWSHMNGENADGLAALWSKYNIEGDFCVEFYAGERHEWYEKAGDLNLTVMNRRNSPADGYTVACTTWDPDFSQEKTYLYRCGEEVAQSDKYLVPRVREGQKRKGYTPLVTGGRDMHGAWYYMKLRRAGSRVSYSFDNEPVFSYDDDDPLPSGAMGIWTYRNSMVVARVKIAAEQITPRPFTFTALPPGQALVTPAAETSPRQDPAQTPTLTLNDRPLTPLTPALWVADDPVSRPLLSWSPPGETEPVMHVAATQAGGTLLTRPLLPPLPLDALAGWSFEISRSDDAKVNALFSLGTITEGAFTPSREYAHRLSGTDDERGPRVIVGATEIDAATADDPREGPWTPVTVWIPADPRLPTGQVRFDGFGNLQPSRIQQGLQGNLGSARYAIRHFREIYRQVPTVVATHLPGETAGPQLDALQHTLAQRAPGNVRRQSVALPGLPQDAEICWIDTPETSDWQIAWSDTIPDAVTITSPLPWPDPDLSALRVSTGGTPCQLRREKSNTTLALLPRTPGSHTNLSLVVETLRPPHITRTTTLAQATRTTNTPPVLLSIKGPIHALATHEQRPFTPLAQAGSAKFTAVFDDPQQGTCLRVSNEGTAGRLATPLTASVNLAQFPLLQLRYRAEGLARVSLILGSSGYAAFSEPYSSAKPVRGATDVALDNQWHTWLGVLSDALPSTPIRGPAPLDVASLSMRSADAQDRTGLYSSMQLDDIMLGGAVGPNRPLTLTPLYFDVDGIRRIEASVYAGTTPYDALSASNQSQLVWQELPLDTPFTPDLKPLPDGLIHVLMRAADTRWAVSAITDLAFLVDRTPVKATHSVQAGTTYPSRSALHLQFTTHGGSPLQLGKLQLKHDDELLIPRGRGGSAEMSPQSTQISLDWAWLLRKPLNQSKDGDIVALTIANIFDGADNRIDDLKIPFTVDYKSDRVPPAMIPAKPSDTVWWTTDWQDAHAWHALRTVRTVRVALKQTRDGAPYQELKSYSAAAGMVYERFAKPWDVETYPYLALRIAATNQIPAGGAASVAIAFEVERPRGGERNRHYERLPLGPFGPNTKGKITSLPAEVQGFSDWSPGHWNTIIVDARAFLTARKGGAINSVHGFGIEITGITKTVFHLADVWILKSWGPEDRLSLDGYDASGVSGLTLPDGRDTEAFNFLPAQFAPADGSAGWCEVRLRDRAGNRSYPIQIPIPPSPKATE